MNTERSLDQLVAEYSVDLQLRCLFKPEPGHSGATQMKAGRASVKLNHGLSSLFVCCCVAIAALVLFAMTLFWNPAIPMQSAAHSPALLDGEMAVIYRFEQAQTDPYAQETTSDSFDTTWQSEINWLQIVNQLKRHLAKALLVKQLHRLVSLQKNSLYKLKYSGLVYTLRS